MARKGNYLRLGLFAGILLLVLVLGIVLIARGCAKADDESEAPGKTKTGGAKTELLASQTVYPFNDGYITSNGVYIRAYDQKNAQRWEFAPDSGDVQFSASDNLVALWKDEGLYILDSDGQSTYSGRLSQPISQVRCGISQVAVQFKDGDSVQILSRDGNTVDTLELENLSILDFGFHSSNDLVWVMALDNSGTIPISYVNTYQPGKLSTGSHKFNDQIVYKALFDQNTSYLVTSRYLRVSAETDSDILIYGWQYLDSAATRDGTALLFTRTNQISNPSDIKVICGSAEYDLRFPTDCMHVVAGDKYIYGVGPNAVYRMAYEDGASPQSFPTQIPINGIVAQLENGRLLVESENMVYMISLP